MTPAAQPKKMTPLAKSSMGLPCLPCPCAFVEALTKPFHHEALMKPFQSLPRSGGFRLVPGSRSCRLQCTNSWVDYWCWTLSIREMRLTARHLRFDWGLRFNFNLHAILDQCNVHFFSLSLPALRGESGGRTYCRSVVPTSSLVPLCW